MRIALRLLVALTLCFSFTLAMGCGDDDSKSVPRQFCEKLQSCNLMKAGTNVDTCTETIEKAWNLAPSAKKTDCENSTNTCIGKADCGNFSTCINNTLGGC